MIDVSQALHLLCGEIEPLGTETVDLAEAHGRVLARGVAADRDFPPTDRSAMDGFAVCSADLERSGRELVIVGEQRAGAPRLAGTLESGQAVRIMTGAIVPAGADAVVMVEHTVEDRAAGRVRIDEIPRPGQHIRRQGEDIQRGGAVAGPGLSIASGQVAALASVGLTRIEVYRRPVVHVLSTGDEIVEPDRQPGEHQVRNSNAPTLIAQLRELGIEGRYIGIAGDTRADLNRALERGLAGDLLLITGGVSAGDYDLVDGALAAAGMRLLFHKVAIKPGKPILAGRRGDCMVVGLPGNPLSTYIDFAVFVAPALRKMTGHERWQNERVTAVLDEPLRTRPGREGYHLARVTAGKEGFVASRVKSSGSGDVLALAQADGFIVTDPSVTELPAGSRVPVLLLR